MKTLVIPILLFVFISGVISSAANAPDILPLEDVDTQPLIRVNSAAEKITDDVKRLAANTPEIRESLMDLLQSSSLTNIAQTVFEQETTRLVASAYYNYNVSEQCINDTEKMIVDLTGGQHYALQMLDAFGKVPSGLLSGHFQWPGAYEECMNVTSNTGNFIGKYCSASIGGLIDFELAPGQKLGITLGTCFPSSCSAMDAVGLLNAALSITANKTTGVQKVHADYAVCAGPVDLDSGAIAALVIIGFLLFFVVMGTLYDAAIRCMGMLHEEDSGEVTEEEKTSLLDGSVKIQTPRERGTVAKVLLSFSAITNGGKILTVGNIKTDIGCIHGIRVLSMWWVILGHVYAFSVYNVDNLLDLAGVLKRFSFQAIGNATFSVDSFFFLSGLLVTFLILKEMRAKDGKVNWALLYFHRFWRLTPAYMFVLMFYTALAKYINIGPAALVANTQKNPCVDYWWTNLLYINNFYPTDSQLGCMGWGWYLANDMQFFLITPIILFILYKNRIAGLAVIFAITVASLIATGVISKAYELSIFDVGVPPNNVNTTSGFNQIYVKPYTRISTYTVGMFAGYILYLTDCQKMFKGARFRLYALIGWLCAALICISVLYGCYGYVHDQEKMSIDLSAFYNSVSRFAWSVGLMIVVVACVHGHGGPVDAFLSWSGWVPLSRLTYCAYLVHPVIIFLYVMGLKEPIHYEDVGISYLFIGHLVVSYAWAFLTSLVIEAPMMGLEKIIFKR
ncbi:nose resistant to fluoxetine protein 6-like isoform X2 [Lineus longissimus]|uniref:nose resistant to fluoxetine protein 6-like isoform X2 n=1 Tax=Lineus longissimus TaxID=88925 RepID=UPI002B4EE9D8